MLFVRTLTTSVYLMQWQCVLYLQVPGISGFPPTNCLTHACKMLYSSLHFATSLTIYACKLQDRPMSHIKQAIIHISNISPSCFKITNLLIHLQLNTPPIINPQHRTTQQTTSQNGPPHHHPPQILLLPLHRRSPPSLRHRPRPPCLLL